MVASRNVLCPHLDLCVPRVRLHLASYAVTGPLSSPLGGLTAPPPTHEPRRRATSASAQAKVKVMPGRVVLPRGGGWGRGGGGVVVAPMLEPKAAGGRKWKPFKWCFMTFFFDVLYFCSALDDFFSPSHRYKVTRVRFATTYTATHVKTMRELEVDDRHIISLIAQFECFWENKKKHNFYRVHWYFSKWMW